MSAARQRSVQEGPAATTGSRKDTVPAMLWTILVILFALWILGLIGSVGGAAIHLLLVVAAVVLVAQLLNGRRTA